jgi:hypothetical protein
MPIATVFRYDAQPNFYRRDDAFVAVLPSSIGTKSVLLEALATSLAFPVYFGSNWDALFDCFRDFSWIDEHDIVVVHTDLPTLPPTELRIYLRLLRDSVADWRPGEAHRLEVVFPILDREIVEGILNEA